MDFTKLGKPIGKKPIQKEIGVLYKDALFLRQEVATATGEDGTEYEITLNLKGPIMIESSKTKITWLLPVRKMLEIAIAEGINDDQEWEDKD